MGNEKYDPEKEIEKLCGENKIVFTMNNQGKFVEFEAIEAAGLLNLAHAQLLKFIEEKRPNGFHILVIKHPETKAKYPLQINYSGGEDPSERRRANFILDSSGLPQRIDHAVGSIKINGDVLRYYGVKLNEEIEKVGRNGEVIIQIKKVPAIVLENGEIISEHSFPEEVNFEFDSIMTLRTNRWDLDSIKDFCNGKIDKEKYTFEKVFKIFKGFYNENMVFSYGEWYSLLALRDMKSYFWDLVDKFLIIKHEGISGTAKSKGMKIGANLSFNGKKFLCPTPATFFRYRHHNKATLFIEEAEKLFDDSKKKTIGDSEMVEYLNGSYEKGNTVPRQNDRNINQTDEFDPAGELAIGSISPLKGALEKRSIPLHMIKASRNDPRSNTEPPSESDPEYKKARDMMYICGLLHYQKFKEAIDDVQNNYGLANRQWVVSKSLIAMARCVSEDLEKETGRFIARLFQIRDESADEHSWEVILANLLIEIYAQRKEDFVSVEEIKNRFVPRLEGEYKISNDRVGKLMGKLGFSDFRTRDSSGTKRGFSLTFFKVCEILLRQEWLPLEVVVKTASEVSMCQFSEDRIRKWYSDTFLTPDTLLSKENNPDTSDRQDTCLLENIDFSELKIKEVLNG